MQTNIIVKKVTKHIENHLGDDLSLESIAQELHYSKFYIAKTFAKETNETIYKYIQRQRLAQAARQLVETKKPIIDIAYDAHYQSQQAFTLAFSQLYLCTPQVYRSKGIFSAMPLHHSIPNAINLFTSINSSLGGEMAA